MLEYIQNLLVDQQVKKIQTVQSLWSGYGEIARYFSPRLNTSVIVKYINPPAEINHPRGWNSQISHQRKLQSYQVEENFYQHYAKQSDRACRVPKLIASSGKQLTSSQQSLMILEDLDQAGFPIRKTRVELNDVKLALRWLAYFHVNFLNQQSEGLWSVGTYWHLATRQDELAVMENSELKQAASAIDLILNQAKYQTLVHGDAKLANFCFVDGSCFADDSCFAAGSGFTNNSRCEQIAAVDFQYVGKGVGVKDVAYFLGSCLADDDLFEYAPSLLDEYFSQLKQAILEYKVVVDFVKLETEWRYLYVFAWADFHRFMQGWSPTHFKINAYMQTQTELALSQC